MTHILKPSKTQLKQWEKLHLSKVRRQEGLFLAEGAKIVGELIRSRYKIAALLLLDEKADRWQGAVAEGRHETLYRLTAGQWHTLSQDKAPEGIMAVASMPRHDSITGVIRGNPGHLLLLDQINNPNNLGALLRTALWFGIRLVLLSRGSVDYTNPKVVRSSMGSLFHQAIIDDLDFFDLLPEIRKHHVVVGSHPQLGVRPHHSGDKGTALLLGNESHGLSDDLLALTDELWHIPGAGDMESLSLPQAAAIMMYECTSNDQEVG